MTTTQYVRVFARFWPLIVLCALLGWGAAFVTTQANPTTYVSSGVVLVGTPRSQTAYADAYQATLLARQRMATYAELANNQLAEDITNEENLNFSTEELAGRIEVSVPDDSSLLKLVVSDTDRGRVRQLSTWASDKAATLVNGLERARGATPTLLKARVISPASEPVRVTPPVWRNPVLGVAAGGALGMAIAVMASQLDRRVHDAATAKTRLGSPPLVVVSKGQRRGGSNLQRGTHDQAVNELRTVLFFQRPTRKRSLSIAFTSPYPMAELFPLASDLAAALTAVGARVLVVDANLRSTAETSVAGIPHKDGPVDAGTSSSPGLSTHLDSTLSSHDLIRPGPHTGFDVVPAGPPSDSAPALLHTHAFQRFLDDVEARYDFILVVAPAMSIGADALAVAAQCGRTLLAMKREHTRTDQLESARDRLLSVDAPLVGAVLFD